MAQVQMKSVYEPQRFSQDRRGKLLPYGQWIESLGLPIHRGYFIEDARTLEVAPWPEMECNAAFIELEGMKGVSEARITEIPPGGTPAPVKFGLDDAVYVLDQYRGVVLLGADGKSIATHALDIAESDLVTYLRTATGGDGKRYYVGGGAGQTRFHLFDEQWKRRFSLPEEDDAAQMISDLVLADLDGDEHLEIYVSHWQDLPLYRFSLDGKRTAWRGESVRDVLSLALSPADSEGKRLLLALGRSGKIRGVAAKGKIDAESDAPDPTVQKLVVAERDIDRDVFWIALSMAPRAGAVVAMKGDSQLAWRFEVPGGFPQTAIEPVVWGRVLPGGKSHWVVAGADGGIHVVAADGTLVDRFHHGETPTGIALARLAGEPTLLVSSKSGVTAYRLTEK